MPFVLARHMLWCGTREVRWVRGVYTSHEVKSRSGTFRHLMVSSSLKRVWEGCLGHFDLICGSNFPSFWVLGLECKVRLGRALGKLENTFFYFFLLFSLFCKKVKKVKKSIFKFSWCGGGGKAELTLDLPQAFFFGGSSASKDISESLFSNMRWSTLHLKKSLLSTLSASRCNDKENLGIVLELSTSKWFCLKCWGRMGMEEVPWLCTMMMAMTWGAPQIHPHCCYTPYCPPFYIPPPLPRSHWHHVHTHINGQLNTCPAHCTCCCCCHCHTALPHHMCLELHPWVYGHLYALIFAINNAWRRLTLNEAGIGAGG